MNDVWCQTFVGAAKLEKKKRDLNEDILLDHRKLEHTRMEKGKGYEQIEKKILLTTASMEENTVFNQ